MRLDDLMDAIGKIDLRFVKEAEDASDYGMEEDRRNPGKKLFSFVRRNRILTTAACLAMILVGGSAAFLLTFRCGSSAPKDGSAAQYATGAAEDTKGDIYEESAADNAAKDNGAADSAAKDDSADTGGQIESDMAAAEEIHINAINEVVSMEICMAQPDTVKEMTIEEAEEYYGLRIMPETLPEGVTCEENPLRVGYTKDGTVMDDNNSLNFLDADGTLRLSISARTTESGLITDFASDDLETSVIGNTTLLIGYDSSGDGYYLVRYEKENVIVTVQGYGIGQEELLEVLRSLLAE